ncbi:hypothetical protein [Prevotella melaninogenica]|uniref:hypothetical protein n=1 Tax=Prevotella melaninogenica TaxID=28132 RepID=UPI001BA986DA|nr:hypothetical protein [Prevotella melaninogenica]QUB66058.1 hypothetical protein J5A57_02895 [Prevotella melaninogenica]
MKVELQCGDTITIPEGCKAIIKDGSVVFEKEEKEEVQEFKEGDVLHSVHDGIMVIFEKYSTYYSFTSHYSTLDSVGLDWAVKSFRLATEEEKQLLFDKMKEQGLRWNAEEKKVEKTRWRAEKGYIYHRLTCYLRSTHERDDYQTWNKKCHDSYNYFHTEEQTKEAAKRVRETLRKYHEEIGE